MANRIVSRRGLLVFFMLVLFFSAASAVRATTLSFAGTTGSVTLNVSDPDATPSYSGVNAVIDPYKGMLGGDPVLIWCVDPDHEVSSGDTWNVNVSYSGGDLSHTYLNNATTYNEMAWLITQFQGANTATQQELQAAIWYTAEGGIGASDFTVNVPASNTAFWNAVNTDIANAATSANSLTTGYEILSDTAGSRQEFIVMTPEPSSLLLLAIGLTAPIVFASKEANRVASGV